MREFFRDKRFGAAALATIDRVNTVCADYQRQGFDLTLRQLYYQFVARGWVPNKDTEYKKLGELVSDGRLAGLIDWDYIVDRTRHSRARYHWQSQAQIIRNAALGYHKDLWAGQDVRLEVWIEKDALIGVIEDVCTRNDVAYFSCRGYVSQSTMFEAGERLKAYTDDGLRTIVLHLGDHDPSGIQMTEDIETRLMLFMEEPEELEVRRIALTLEQVAQYRPPPNPAKVTDARYASYARKYGTDSWELDALDPATLGGLIEQEIRTERDDGVWRDTRAALEEERKVLQAVSDRWGEVRQLVS